MKKKNKIFGRILIVLVALILLLLTSEKVREKFAKTYDSIMPEDNRITSQNYMIVDLKTGKKVESKGESSRVIPASIAKLFPMYYTSSLFSSNELIDCSQEAYNLAGPNSSLAKLKPGSYYAKNVYHGMLVPSGNDVAFALAENVGGRLDKRAKTTKEKVSVFTNYLDEYIRKNGMLDTRIVDVSGYSKENYTTINDVDKVVRYLLQVKWFRELSSLPDVVSVTPSGKEVSWKNTNKFMDKNSIFYNKNVYGIKTGSLEEYYNLVTLYKNGKSDYLIYVFGAKTDERRYKDTLKLIEKIDSSK